MPTIFSRIISGELPAYKVAEDDNYIAILDINPLVMGHVLVIPKKETDYIFDIADEEYAGLWLFAKKVAAAIRATVPCKRVGVAVIGLEVPHAHIHLVPLEHVGDINFTKAKLHPSQEALAEMAERIRGGF